MTGSETFEQVWEPRIGPDATAQLRRTSYVALATAPSAIGLAVACSFAFGVHTVAGTLLGVACALCAIGAFAVGIRSRMRLAATVSHWFGVRIGWQEMPRMRPPQFDAWVEKRGLFTATGRPTSGDDSS